MVDEEVESCEAGEGNDVHDDEVEPGDVDADVGRVVPQRRRHHDRHVVAVLHDVQRVQEGQRQRHEVFWICTRHCLTLAW